MFASNPEAGSWAVDILLLLTIPALVIVNGLFVAAEFAGAAVAVVVHRILTVAPSTANSA